MMLRDKVKLISITYTENDMGDLIETPTTTEVCTDELSYASENAKQAMADGLKQIVALIVRKTEYKDETKAEYHDKAYKIINAPLYKKDFRELICESMVNDNATS
jgi:hypothetical protein